MFALLGDIEFDLITYFDGFESQFGADYAEHALIAGKPRLQWIGDKLDEIRIQLSFHAVFCDPEEELAALQEALVAHQAMALVLGNGDYKGWFVLTEVTATSKQTDTAGSLVALEANITLREFVGDKKNPLPPPAMLLGSTPTMPSGASNASRSGVQPDVAPVAATALPANPITGLASLAGAATGAANSIRDNISQAVACASQAQSALRMAGDAARLAQNLRANPLAALGQVPGVLTNVKQALGPLEKLSPSLANLSGQLPGVSGIVRASDNALGMVRNAQGALSGLNVGNVTGRLDYLSGQVTAASNALASAAPSISKLASKVITRGMPLGGTPTMGLDASDASRSGVI